MIGYEDRVEAYTPKVFEMQGGKSVSVNDEKCLGCESCREVCEEKAMRVMSPQLDLSETCRFLLRDIF